MKYMTSGPVVSLFLGLFVLTHAQLDDVSLLVNNSFFDRKKQQVAMVWSGKGVVKAGRVLLGETNPLASLPGTIRGDFCIDVGRNLCHGSDSVENAEKEIALWFPHGLVPHKRVIEKLIYE